MEISDSTLHMLNFNLITRHSVPVPATRAGWPCPCYCLWRVDQPVLLPTYEALCKLAVKMQYPYDSLVKRMGNLTLSSTTSTAWNLQSYRNDNHSPKARLLMLSDEPEDWLTFMITNHKSAKGDLWTIATTSLIQTFCPGHEIWNGFVRKKLRYVLNMDIRSK